MRFMCFVKADANSEAGAPPDEALVARMGEFVQEITDAGVLIATDGLHPSSKGKRITLANGRRTVIDGPFTESKELIASYAIVQTDTYEEAVEWSYRFLDVLGQGEVELRPIVEWEDLPPVYTPEMKEQEDRIRAVLATRQ